jgi:hypothetical protein
MRKLLGVVLMLAGTPVWALGAWRFYDGDEAQGTLLVLGGGLVFIAGLSLYRHDSEIAHEGVWHAFVESISRR